MVQRKEHWAGSPEPSVLTPNGSSFLPPGQAHPVHHTASYAQVPERPVPSLQNEKVKDVLLTSPDAHLLLTV